MYETVDLGPRYQEYAAKHGARGIEHLPGALWDTVSFVSASTLALTLFDTKRASKITGNLPLAGTLPEPNGFICTSVRFRALQRPEATVAAATTVTQTGVTDDLAQLLEGILEVGIGDEEAKQAWPLWMLPSGGGVWPVFQTGDIDVVVDMANNGVPDARNAYVLPKPFFIPPVTAISARLSWLAVITLALGNTNVQVLFDGLHTRPRKT